MSVLIKGMEMPTCCATCRVGYSLLGHRCMRTGRFVDPDEAIKKHEEHCPLVPVPPHGRLIDADALVNELVHSKFFSMSDYNNFVGLAFKAPTIIPAEEGE